MTTLIDIIGSKYPILQGPIGRLNDPKMVAAVSESGGFGMLALGLIRDLEEVKKLVKKVKELTDKPFGANLMIATNPANERILEILSEAGIKTVTTSAGAPQKLYPKIKELKMNVLHLALLARDALKATKAGADGIIVSGAESGGFRTAGPESTNMILIPLVSEMVNLPVVAAGGIADRRGYRAALALGAQGVQLGTRFIASKESPAPMAWKEAIINCSDAGTVLIPQGSMTSRVIINSKLNDLLSSGADVSKKYDMANMWKAWLAADFDLFPAGAGQVSALIKEIKPVKDIIEEMVS
jgi:enoyl-[acyl-carrier protein] reductase II